MRDMKPFPLEPRTWIVFPAVTEEFLLNGTFFSFIARVKNDRRQCEERGKREKYDVPRKDSVWNHLIENQKRKFRGLIPRTSKS
jgi:hypothetical protein